MCDYRKSSCNETLFGELVMLFSSADLVYCVCFMAYSCFGKIGTREGSYVVL